MILFVTYNRLPYGDAGSIRNSTLAKLFNSIGYEVNLIGMSNDKYGDEIIIDDNKYVSLRISGDGILNKLNNYFGYKSRLIDYLSCIETEIDAIIINGLPLNTFFFIKGLCKGKSIPIVFDCCEWYSPSQFKLGRLDPRYILNTINNRIQIKNMTIEPIIVNKRVIVT